MISANHTHALHSSPSVWTDADDAALEVLVGKHVNDWPTIAEQLPGRTWLQCSSRWVHCWMSRSDVMK